MAADGMVIFHMKNKPGMVIFHMKNKPVQNDFDKIQTDHMKIRRTKTVIIIWVFDENSCHFHIPLDLKSDIWPA